jgi:uncharacterized protein with HEPN domain
MISKHPVLRLHHIQFHIEGLLEMLNEVNFDGFKGNYALERATERGISIISEAAKLLPVELRAEYPQIPWMHIIGIGNILRHEYERVDPAIMWDIVQNHIPSMQVVIARMISDVPDER